MAGKNRDHRRSKDLHPKQAHAFMVRSGLVEDKLVQVIEEVTRRVQLTQSERAQKRLNPTVKVNYRRYVEKEHLARIHRTTIWTVKEAFLRLDADIRDAYDRGLCINRIMQSRIERLTSDYHKYEKEKCWSVISYIRKRIKVNRPILSCGDLGAQFQMNGEAVRLLIHDRLSSDELEKWKVLVHRSKKMPISRMSPTLKPKKTGTIPRTPSVVERKYQLVARGWQKYPSKVLEEMLDFVRKDMDKVESGDGMITNYYTLRVMFGVSVGVMPGYFQHTLGPIQFDRRKRLSKIRRSKKKGEENPAAGA